MPDEATDQQDVPESVAEREADAAAAADASVTEALVGALPVAVSPETVVEAEAELAVATPTEAVTEVVVVEAEGIVPERKRLEPKPAALAHEMVLERKHPLAIRWMHWINFPVLFTMMWSGFLIYWNDSIPPYAHSHEVYRVGIGSWTLFRFFPEWVYTNRLWDVRYKPTTGLGYHFLFMWFFAINGLVYVAFLLISKEWKFMVPLKSSVRDAIQVTLVDLHLKKGLPPQTKYNGGQRIAYTSVILMGLGSLVTGLAIYKPTQLHYLTSALGGYEMARWLHFLLTLGFCGFFLVHVGQVILAGWNNFRAMVSGYEIRRADEPSLEAERRKF